MDFILITAGFVLLIAGIIGCIVPFLPGPPLSFVALLLLQFSSLAPFDEEFLLMWGAITVAITVLDYWAPVYGTKRLGGTKSGTRGAAVGLIIGLFFFPPFGLIIGPFVGALSGELIAGQEFSRAIKSALGSFAGFLTGVLLKMSLSLIMSYHFIVNLRL